MPLYLKDDETAGLMATLAERLGTTKQHAVKTAVIAELGRQAAVPTAREKLAALRSRHPRPRATGNPADKAFYDELSGEPVWASSPSGRMNRNSPPRPTAAIRPRST